MASIYEVAREAGVSITTVSHVFSGRRPVAPQTRARVIEAARKLNYRPHRIARGLATGRSMILGVQFPFEGDLFVNNPYFPELLEGLSTAAARAGYGFLLIPRLTGGDDDIDRETLLKRIDGAIVVDPAGDDPDLPQLLKPDMACVTIGRYGGDDNGIPWVDSDHRDGIAQLFRHFDAQGYRNPALISTTWRYSYSEDIESAFSAAAQERGLPAHIVHSNSFADHETYRVASELLGRHDRPDVIVASTDHQAMVVLRLAQDLGIQVPAELGVAGEGDTVLARNALPPLTSIRVHSRRLGEAAVTRLLAILDGDETDGELLLPARLIVRESTLRV